MSALAATVAVLEAFSPPDERQSVLRRQLLDHLAERPDGLLRSCRPDHLTASVLVLDHNADRALLTLHAKARAWFQLGGHIEPADAGVVEAAHREAQEESGLTGLRLDPLPVQLDVHPVPFCGDGVLHLDVRFVALASDGSTERASEESAELRWWPVDRLPDGELVELVGLARARVLAG